MNDREKQSSFFRFEDLRLYGKALDYIKWLSGAIKPAKTQHLMQMSDLFFKSAQNILLHMAEGSSRNRAQFVHYIKMSKSAVRECVVFTEIATCLNLFSENDREISRTHLMELTKMLGALVTSLQKAVSFKDEVEADTGEFDEIMDME